MGIDALFLEKTIGIPTLFFEEINSTNLYCKERIKNGTPFEGLVIASRQTNGQGRLGKSFYSPKDSGLYLTFCLKQDFFLQNNLTPRIALAVCHSIEQVFGISCGIKWVNDIYVGLRKAGGVLCQAIDGYFLIGIGINLTKPDYIPSELESRLGWIADSANEKQKNDLIQALYCNILRYDRISNNDAYMDYCNRCIHIGKQVEIEHYHSSVFGKCLGIDEKFNLLVEVNGKVQSFSSGYMVLHI